jgi:polyketide biosynthesis 3-hydroxy-3-methylglutaryl-CoA synthase-like enzyme PksG
MKVGIEALNVYGGLTYLNIRDLFVSRGLDLERFDNLMMEKKSVNLPCEDPVTVGVNAAKPIIDRLSEAERSRIELIITSSETGIDFGKSISTYIHDYLNLSRECRLFEVKQACYGGTASLQMAVCFIASQVSPGSKALVIATDIARAAGKKTYGEPSQGVGAVAMLISNNPEIFEIDLGAAGYHSYEIMDTCRPLPEIELGNADLSLLSYLDCLENSFKTYSNKVEGVSFKDTFDYFAFHTPFAGMVKGAHRKMMRQFTKSNIKEIEADYEKRIKPSLIYCTQIGNIYSATVFLALCGLIDNADFDGPKRVGIFSYGSGCSSEFYSGIISNNSKKKLSKMNIKENLSNRYDLTMEQYDHLLDLNLEWMFGVKDKQVDFSKFSDIYEKYAEGRGLLVLKEVKDFHRKYIWS